MSVFVVSCSKDAINASKSPAVSANTINGTWKHANGDVLAISMTTGNGVYKAGPAPSGAVGGNSLTNIVYKQGTYWEARSHTYYSSGWSTNYTTVGLAMETDTKTFKIGTQVYTRQ
ncbi:MAG: hypothetical protein ABI388_07680 [Bacteroidia bacterium]